MECTEMKYKKCRLCKDVDILHNYVEMIATIRRLDKQATTIYFELNDPCLLVCEQNKMFLKHSGCPKN